jgi:hypothetical protein
MGKMKEIYKRQGKMCKRRGFVDVRGEVRSSKFRIFDLYQVR